MTAGVMCPLTLPICLYRTKMFHYQHTMKLLVQFPAVKGFPVVQYYCLGFFFSDEGYLRCTINTGTFLFRYGFMFRDKRQPWAHVRKHPLCEYLSPQSHTPMRHFDHSSSSSVACLMIHSILFLCQQHWIYISNIPSSRKDYFYV